MYQIKANIWGQWCWHLMHTISTQDNKEILNENKLCYKKIYTLLGYILPCSICTKHYNEILEKNPIILNKLNRKYIIKWVIKIHNCVNKKIGKNTVHAKDYMNSHHRVDNITNFKFLNAVYKDLNKNLSLNEVNNYKTFIKCLAQIYPNKRYQELLLKITNTNKFNNISTGKELVSWYTNNYKKWQN